MNKVDFCQSIPLPDIWCLVFTDIQISSFQKLKTAKAKTLMSQCVYTLTGRENFAYLDLSVLFDARLIQQNFQLISKESLITNKQFKSFWRERGHLCCLSIELSCRTCAYIKPSFLGACHHHRRPVSNFENDGDVREACNIKSCQQTYVSKLTLKLQ